MTGRTTIEALNAGAHRIVFALCPLADENERRRFRHKVQRECVIVPHDSTVYTENLSLLPGQTLRGLVSRARKAQSGPFLCPPH